MNSFHYYNPAQIVFGIDSQYKIKELLQTYKVTSLLLVYSGDFIKQLGIFDVVKDACQSLHISFFENGSVVPNPKVELVRDLISLSKKENVDFVLAVGGGSAIDTAKAVAVGIPYAYDVWDFFEYKCVPESAIPIGVITTLPASGSESSNCSIISNGIHKVGIEYDCIIPKFSIMNPQYTIGLPQYQTSCGLADILSHMLERYFSDVEYTDTTDFLIEGAIKALILNSQRLMVNPDDINARSEVQCLAFLAHNNLLDIGRASDWASHRIEHELSAQYGITHGEGMAIVLVAWTKYMAIAKPKKLAQLANRVFHIDYHDFNETQMAQQLSKILNDFFLSLGLKTNLSDMGIDDSYFEEMAMRATSNDTQTVGHYISLEKKEFIEILNLAR